LNLLVTAIILWNTRYLNRAIAALREVEDVPDHLLAHLSPLVGSTSISRAIMSGQQTRGRQTLTDIDRSASPPRLLSRPREFSVCPLMLQKLAVR
jgi:hypothetical protein